MKTFLLFILIFFVFPSFVFAQDSNNQFITIVNPVRISRYTQDIKANIKVQYEQTKIRNLPATWLLTFDVLENTEALEILSDMDKSQELGIFLEVSHNFASKSNVEYNKTDSWHRAHALFLSGYTQEDRKKLIDTVFEKFKQVFHFYPKSVGAWWIDSYSLDYMQKKYNVIANLGLADQFEVDGYSVWGQYWSTPFIPSKYHAGIPADSEDNKINLVTLQWAPRDPLNGYGRTPANRYSTQDYFTIGLEDNFFSKLLDLYSSKNFNHFGQITIGLEADLGPSAYYGIYAKQLDIAKTKEVQFLTMSGFAKWYLSNFQKTPPQTIISGDFLGSQKKVIWYQSPNYRIGLSYDGKTNQTEVFDFRVYPEDFEEPNYISPNKQLNLYIHLPSLIDKTSYYNSSWIIAKNKLTDIVKQQDNLTLKFTAQEITFTEKNIILKNTETPPSYIKNSPLVTVGGLLSNLTLTPKAQYFIPKEGLVFRGLSINTSYFLKRPKIQIFIKVSVLLTILLTALILYLQINTSLRLKIIRTLLAVLILGGGTWFYLNSQIYQVTQSEIDTLLKLRGLPYGKVVVFDGGCLICSFHTKYPPPIFANNRSYVENISKKPLVYNLKIFETESRSDGRKELKRIDAKYIYLTKFEDYQEALPFSPGDYSVDLIFENASAQIWKIRDNPQ